MVRPMLLRRERCRTKPIVCSGACTSRQRAPAGSEGGQAMGTVVTGRKAGGAGWTAGSVSGVSENSSSCLVWPISFRIQYAHFRFDPVADLLVDGIRGQSCGVDQWADRYGHKAWLLDESRSEEHTSELQSLMRTSYAVFC